MLTCISFTHLVVVVGLFVALIVQLCVGYVESVEKRLDNYLYGSNSTQLDDVSTWHIAFKYVVDTGSIGAPGIICEIKCLCGKVQFHYSQLR